MTQTHASHRLPEVTEIIEIPRDFLTADEDEFERRFLEDVGDEVGLVDVATGLLVHVITAVEPRTITGALDDDDEPILSPETAKAMQTSAMVLIGARALRVIRAARAVLGRGFEAEARAHDRILVELLAHRRVILDDPSGREALAWMQRKRTHGVTKKVAAMGSEELYGNLCTDAHGDPMPLFRIRDAKENSIELAPARTNATRASLLMYAGFARDQAMIVSRYSSVTVLTGIEQLDAGIDLGWSRLQSGGANQPGSGADEPE